MFRKLQAVIYWQLDAIRKSATSFIKYGKSDQLEKQTPVTKKPRWAHFHRLTGLDSGSTYFYKMVVIHPDNTQTESELMQLTPRRIEGAIRIPQDMPDGPPYLLDRDDAYYILTKDIKADGTALIVKGSRTTLDLDGHTVVFWRRYRRAGLRRPYYKP